MTDYARERLRDILEEAKPLVARNWEEIDDYQDVIKLNPSYDKYLKLDDMGLFQVFTMRDGGILVGYAAYIVFPHLHHGGDLFAFADLIWVAPEYRKGRAGINLLRFVEQCLRDDGVSLMHTTAKVSHPTLGKVLESIGHRHTECGYSKVFKHRVE